MKNLDVKMHVQGKAKFVDDITAPEGLLHAAIFTSPIAKGIIKNIDIDEARNADDVVAIYTYKDVPGENQIGHILKDQPLLAKKTVEYIGQPIVLVVAKTKKKALAACKKIKLELQKLTPILSPREAFKKNELFQAARLMKKGDTDSIWKKCDIVVEGTAETDAQEHFYLETQSAITIPLENGNFKVCVSAQSPGGFHHSLSEILGIQMHKIEVEITRLGGGFGGKEVNATWAALSAMAAKLLNRPVKLILNRREDIETSGKRHPFSTDFKLGLDKNGIIKAYEVSFYQNGGAFADISTPVLERCILHATSAYAIPNVTIRAASCRTNIVPHTAFRGFGVPQAVFAIESAIYKAAEKLGVHPLVIQKKNLIKEGYQFPYGMQVENCNATRCWESLDSKYKIHEQVCKVENYNKKNHLTKKGIAAMPVCFGISFTQTALNQASSLVNIYTDGSIGISTGAVEMGQGVNMKMLIIAAKEFSIKPERIKIETTNTTRIPNASPTAASSGADLNGMATKLACQELVKRLKKFISEKLKISNIKDIEIKNERVYLKGKATEFVWEKLIYDAYWNRIDLSCHAFYGTPGVYFDRTKEYGHPFAYHSFGTSIIEVTLDCLRGTYKIDSIDVIHDVGQSISPEIDKGQIAGGVIQGLGYATIENLVFDKRGKILSSVNSYKVPDIKFVPEKFNINFLENTNNPYAVGNSKAVGEPPFIHGIGAYFGLTYALRAARTGKGLEFNLPLTQEKAFLHLYG